MWGWMKRSVTVFLYGWEWYKDVSIRHGCLILSWMVGCEGNENLSGKCRCKTVWAVVSCLFADELYNVCEMKQKVNAIKK